MEKFVLFEAGQEHCGVPMALVSAIESAGALLPGGIAASERQDIAFRGHSVPLVDMPRLLGTHRNGVNPEERKILLLNGRTAPMALLVDRLHAVTEADAGHIRQMPPEVEEPARIYFPRVLRNPDGLAFLLDPEGILGLGKASIAENVATMDGCPPESAATPDSPTSGSDLGECSQGASVPGPCQQDQRPGRVFLSSLGGEPKTIGA